jgi:hypothetical protein
MAGLSLPAYFSYLKWPVKIVPTKDGGAAAWQLSPETGGWQAAHHLIDDIIFDVGGEVDVLTAEEFVQLVERRRGERVSGDGAVFALYETVNGIEEVAESERRRLTDSERSLVHALRRRTFRMFEEALSAAGDPAADSGVGLGGSTTGIDGSL